MQQSLKEIGAAGAKIAAISHDSVEILKRFSDKNAITFPLLSDFGSKTIDAYGIRNQEATGRGAGIPYPGTFILDTNGVIRAKLFLEGYRDRHAIEPLLKALKETR